ncbi:protein MAIN-LIKE 1-like [Glycine soja]|uniref:protein MAIN-LIKE 1-like n=1 Tax=Glycine soja TaxID=3848 RepID=UPI00103EEF73|nr:protein MAIN-LIKE 1-like [Glycine soja]
MVRTRGLRRVVGTGRARDLSQDVAEDVPRCRRPTASARRQRVTQMAEDVAEDVPQLPEDVPQLTEDVPDASDGSPERTGATDAAESDGVASDGTAADDEGFPGGPHDPSVLIGFADHVAHSIWRGQERPDLKLVSHGRKVDKFGRPAAEIEGMIAVTGLDPLIRCSVITTDPGLIFAFVERWHRETSSFHLPVGEVTITLDDVSSLLHIPITGVLYSFGPLATADAIALLMELLEVTPVEATAETRQAGGPHVRLSWLRDMYQSRCRARQWVAAARAYLLHLVGCTLFANKSATHVHVVHLQAFRDLAQAGTFSWGAAALCWIYEHFPSVHRSIVDDGYAEASPCACRWLTGKAQITGIMGSPYRARIDALTVTDVCWMPYAEHRGVRGYELISLYMGQVRWGPIIVYLRPERVVRQMISHPFVTPTEDTTEPRPAPSLPTHDDDFVEPPVAQVPVTSDPPAHSMVDCTTCVRMGRIAEHLEHVINLRMVTTGTDLYDIMDLCLRIARDDDPDDSLRPRQRPRID